MSFFSVVIPVSKPKFFYRRLLESLNSQNFPPQELEVILVGDVGETPSSEKFCYKTIPSDNLGANQARILGEKAASSKYVFFLDDDCLVDNFNLFNEWMSFLEENKEVDIAGGCYKSRGFGFWDNAYNGIVDLWQEAGASEQPNLVGGHLIVRKSVFESIHFDPTIRYGGTETEFIMRARRMELQIQMREELKVEHMPGLSMWQFLKKAYLQGVGKRHHGVSVPNSRVLPVLLRNWTRLCFLPALVLFWFFSQLGTRFGKRNG